MSWHLKGAAGAPRLPIDSMTQGIGFPLRFVDQNDTSGSFNVRDYGATGDGVSDDTLGIQLTIEAARAEGGGTVRVPAGVYKIRQTLVLYSSITLFISNGATIKQEEASIRGENARTLLVNAAYINPVEVVLSSLTASGTTVTANTSVAHNFVVGQKVVIFGIATEGYCGVFEIETVPDPNSFTYESYREPEASPAVPSSITDFTTPTARLCDENITVVGGGAIDYDAENNPNALTNQNAHAVIFSGVFNLSVEGVAINNALKWNLTVAGTRMGSLINGRSSGPSDNIHIQGPSQQILIDQWILRSINPGDNIIGVGTSDYANQIILPGPIEGIEIRNINANEGKAIRFFGSTEAGMRGVKLTNVRGSLTGEAPIAEVKSDPLVLLNGVTVSDITLDNVFAFSSEVSQIRQLSITDGVTVGVANFINSAPEYEGGTYGRMISVGGVVSTVNIDNIQQVNGHSLLDITSTAQIGNINISNTRSNATYGVNSDSDNPLSVNVSNTHLTNAGGSFRDTSTSGKMTVRTGANCLFDGTFVLRRTATQTFSASGVPLKADLAWLDRQDGVIVYNTNAALGTLGVAGLVVGQGTAANSWHLMSDPTKVY